MFGRSIDVHDLRDDHHLRMLSGFDECLLVVGRGPR
jgi:hypothetical protein